MTQMTTALTRAAPPPPMVPGLPLLGSLFPLARDPLGFLTRQYQQLGPVYRFRAGPRRFTVIAGPEANAFTQEDRGECLRADAFWKPMMEEIGSPHFLIGLDGAEHRKLRQAFAPHMSRAVVEKQLDELTHITREAFDDLRDGDAIAFVEFSQRLVSRQVGALMTGRRLEREEFDALFGFTTPVFITLGLLRLPRWTLALRGRAYRRAKRDTLALADRLLTEGAARDDGADRYSDTVRKLATQYAHLFTKGDLRMAAILPFFAGIDTVGQTLAFAMHELLKQPELLARVRDEVDEAFENGVPTPRTMRGLEALAGVVLETLRLHPTAFAMVRRAARDFEFEGHSIREHEDVLVFTTACHFLDEHFPEAHRFDIDRYREPRLEHRRNNVYAPFGRGPHSCLGAAFAEGQLAATLAAMLHHFDLELAEPDRVYRERLVPTPSLGPHFALRLRGRRLPGRAHG